MSHKKYQKTYDSLEFTDDFLFCKILTQDLELTRELLERILEIPIREVKEVQSQKPYSYTAFDRGIRLDVYVEDEENTVYDIEM